MRIAREHADDYGAIHAADLMAQLGDPAFLPVLLWGLAVWFGYDGWINQDPGMLEHVTFNRWGFGILVVLGVYFTIQSIREVRARDNEPPRS